MRALPLIAVLGLVGAAPAVADEPVVIRLATVAPEGSGWAREGLAFAREVDQLTHGRVRIKFYWGSLTGDELQTLEQVRRGRVDAIASGGMSCLRMAPSLLVFRIPGLFRNREEANFVNSHLRPTIDAEFLRSGFINLGELSIGPEMMFTREPMRSMSDLRKESLWVWDLDPILPTQLAAMGLHTLTAPLPEALHQFEGGRVQGFIAVPTAALAFQWSTAARYLSDIPIGMLRGCVVVTTRAFDALSVEDQQAVRAAGAKVVARLEEVGRASDEALLHGLFARQGLTIVKAPESFWSEMFSAAVTARDRMPGSLVPPALVQRVLTLLADYRGR